MSALLYIHFVMIFGSMAITLMNFMWDYLNIVVTFLVSYNWIITLPPPNAIAIQCKIAQGRCRSAHNDLCFSGIKGPEKTNTHP